MEKIVKKYGGTLVITFDPEDIKINNIQEGEVLNVEIKHTEKNEQ
jgi:hypothetical protein